MRPPLVIAHRGASGHAPENTLKAFRLGLDIGADLIETDVRRTGDGHIVALHDATLDRTTDRSGAVCDLLLREIIEADAGEGERVPTLFETLELIRGRALALVEIKPEDITADVIRVIQEADAGDMVVLQSFHPQVISDAGRLAPDIPRGLLFGNGERMVQRAAGVGAGMVVPSFTLITEDLVNDIHRRGMGVWTYTVDDEEDLRRIMDMGVDGIITNYPDRAKK